MSEHSTFIRTHTTCLEVPLCPEIMLYQSHDALSIWQSAEDRAGKQVPPPYWAFCWPGGQALTRYLLDTPEVVRGKKVLDFAAGSGLTAIGAVRAGAASVQAAEIDPLAISAIRLNGATNNVQVGLLEDDIVGQTDAGWDVVVAGDVCYERPMAERVFSWFSLLVAQGVTVLLADPGRSYLPKHGLKRLAEYTVPTSLDLEDRLFRETAVFQVLGE